MGTYVLHERTFPVKSGQLSLEKTLYRLCMGEREKLSRLMRFVVMGVVVLILLALIWVFIQI
jgi:hypothetical protein